VLSFILRILITRILSPKLCQFVTK